MSENVKKILKNYYNLKYSRYENVEIDLLELSKQELVDFILEAQSRRNLELLGIYEEEE